MNASRLLVFDVGGSHISGAFAEHGSLRALHHVPVDCHASSDSFFGAVGYLAGEVLQDAGLAKPDLDGMSFAFPGPFDYGAGISQIDHKFEKLKGLNLRSVVADEFGLQQSAIQFVNDADAFLLGELSQLESPPSRAIGITLGTGVGSSFAVDGRVVHDGDGVPSQGEIWNLPWKAGIVEDAISTRGIQALHQSRTGQQLTVKDIAERAAREPAALETFQSFGLTLGSVLRGIAEGFRPDVVILGGAISRSAGLFLPSVTQSLNLPVELRISALFENAALYGAAVHWQQMMQAASF